jgi:hypothetical protein
VLFGSTGLQMNVLLPYFCTLEAGTSERRNKASTSTPHSLFCGWVTGIGTGQSRLCHVRREQVEEDMLESLQYCNV